MRTSLCVTLSLFVLACDTGGAREDSGAAVEGGCLKALPKCEPAYPPTFDQIFAHTLSSSCGTSRCHEPSFRGGGLGLTQSAEDAYADLVEERASGADVKPGSPECSPLVLRLFSDDPLFKMPRTGSISDGERCAIVQWIANGAEAP